MTCEKYGSPDVLGIGDEIWKSNERRQNIYLVMQDVNHQLFTDSVLEEVMISQEREDKDTALKILESLDLLEYAQRHPLSLSGGQKQRVSIA
ncbi:ATP-binding cassette domain-containing protein [Lachnospiraceae bacterium C1.1]